MLLVLRNDRDRALQELKYIFTECFEMKLMDNFYKIGVIRFNTDTDIVDKLKLELMKASHLMKNKYLKLKIKSILKHKQMQLI